MNRGPLAIVVLSALATLAACRDPHPKAAPRLAAELAPLVYPGQAPLGADLDIVVVRHGSSIELANREPRTFSNVQLWLNQQYVGKVEHVAIGTGNHLDLAHFVNKHGEQYPTAGLLIPERSLRLVLAELYDPATGQRHRLLVALQPDES